MSKPSTDHPGLGPVVGSDPFEPRELVQALGAAVLVVLALFLIVSFLALPVVPV